MRYVRFIFTYLLVVLVGTLLVQAGASFVQWENYFIFNPALWVDPWRGIFMLWCVGAASITFGICIDDFVN